MKVPSKKTIIVVCVLLLFSIPTVFRVFSIRKHVALDKYYQYPKFPQLKFTRFFSKNTQEKTISDNLMWYYFSMSGYSELLIPLYLGIKNYILNISPYPGKVVLGRKGWLFLGDEYSYVISESKGLINFSEKELQRIQDNLSKTQEYCRRRNIRFYLAIAPDKSDVYGCYLPIEKADRLTKLDQIRSRLSKCDFRMIDLGKNFKHFRNRILYLKTDSHWNNLGLFIGYKTLMKEIRIDFPDIPILHLNQFIVDSVEDYSGDLADMISLRIKSQKLTLTPIFQSKAVIEKNRLALPKNYPYDPSLYEHRYFNKNRRYKTLVIHDSFFATISDFMKENFKESVFLWSYFDYNLIDREIPDIIIYEIAEREVDVLLKQHVVL